jgi:phosphatidylserine synthase
MRTRLRDTYLGYAIGCACTWGVVLLLANRRLDPDSRKTVRLVCSGWWIGWTSATIARIGFPPPKPLTPEAKQRLAIASLVAVALNLVGVIGMLVTGKLPGRIAGA